MKQITFKNKRWTKQTNDETKNSGFLDWGFLVFGWKVFLWLFAQIVDVTVKPLRCLLPLQRSVLSESTRDNVVDQCSYMFLCSLRENTDVKIETKDGNERELMMEVILESARSPDALLWRPPPLLPLLSVGSDGGMLQSSSSPLAPQCELRGLERWRDDGGESQSRDARSHF